MKTLFLLLVFVCQEVFTVSISNSDEIPDEKWGYVTVRKDAHMFWWLYGAQSEKRGELPLVLWLQGGPGGSGAGFGNFAEIGPLDENLKPRKTSWTLKTNLLFIDNPVGAGFSYVRNPDAYTHNSTEIAEDLLVIFSHFLNSFPNFKTTPFYIFCESYGGKMTAVFGKRLYEAIQQKELECNFKGVALGDSWISPVDSTLSWGPYLYQYNLLDQKDLDSIQQVAGEAALAFDEGNYEKSTEYWSKTEDLISQYTDNVNVYNVLQHNAPAFPKSRDSLEKLYNTHVGVYYKESLADLMNTVIRRKLKIIPDDIKWGAQSGDVFKYQSEDFMKPVIKAVDSLISYGLKVVVFQGQLDMICDTPAAETWINKLQWSGLQSFNDVSRKALYVDGQEGQTQAFLKTYENFSLYYIMNAGHMVPLDNGKMALKMLGEIIGS